MLASSANACMVKQKKKYMELPHFTYEEDEVPAPEYSITLQIHCRRLPKQGIVIQALN